MSGQTPKQGEEYKSQQSQDFNGTLRIDNDIKVNLDFPFDLNNLFNMTYSFDILKQAIEFMCQQQIELKTDMDTMKKRMDAYESQDQKVPQTTYNAFCLNVTQKQENQDTKLCEHDNDIKILKELGPSTGGGGNPAGLLDAFKELVEKLRNDLNITINDLDTKVNNNFGDLDDRYKKLEEKLIDLDAKTKTKDNDQQKQIDFLLDEIHKKMNEDSFDDAFANLKEMIEGLGTTGKPIEIKAPVKKAASGPIVTQSMIDQWNKTTEITNEMQKTFKERIERVTMRVTELEKKSADFVLRFELDKTNADLKNLDETVQKEMKASSEFRKQTLTRFTTIEKVIEKLATKDEHNILKQRVDNLEKLMKDMRNQLRAIEDRMKDLRAGTGSGVGADELENLQNQLDDLRREFEQHRDISNRNLNDLNITMPTKADKSELQDLENRFRDKLDEILRQLIELIPNKEEINKRFAAIQKKLREIMEQLKGRHDHEDDAMFTKKPLGPANCASCEKDIINLIGMPVDYHVWKRMPQRGAPDRIARYGQGFSKLLSNLQYQTDLLAGHSLHESMDHDHSTGISPMKNQNFRRTQPPEGFEMSAREKKQARNKSTIPNTRSKMKSSLPNATTIDDSNLGGISASLMEGSVQKQGAFYDPAEMNNSNQTLPHLNNNYQKQQ